MQRSGETACGARYARPQCFAKRTAIFVRELRGVFRLEKLVKSGHDFGVFFDVKWSVFAGAGDGRRALGKYRTDARMAGDNPKSKGV